MISNIWHSSQWLKVCIQRFGFFDLCIGYVLQGGTIHPNQMSHRTQTHLCGRLRKLKGLIHQRQGTLVKKFPMKVCVFGISVLFLLPYQSQARAANFF